MADWNEPIAAVRALWQPKCDQTFETALERALPSEGDTHEPHEQVWDAAWALIAAEGEAGFLFGVSVGLDVAALTVRGELPRLTKKGGRR